MDGMLHAPPSCAHHRRMAKIQFIGHLSRAADLPGVHRVFHPLLILGRKINSQPDEQLYPAPVIGAEQDQYPLGEG